MRSARHAITEHQATSTQRGFCSRRETRKRREWCPKEGHLRERELERAAILPKPATSNSIVPGGRRKGSRSENGWTCLTCNMENWWSRKDCRSHRKTLSTMGSEETSQAGTEVLEKELEWLLKKLKGPKNTAKQTEAERTGSTERRRRSRRRSRHQTAERDSRSGVRGDLEMELVQEGEYRWTKHESCFVARKHGRGEKP